MMRRAGPEFTLWSWSTSSQVDFNAIVISRNQRMLLVCFLSTPVTNGALELVYTRQYTNGLAWLVVSVCHAAGVDAWYGYMNACGNISCCFLLLWDYFCWWWWSCPSVWYFAALLILQVLVYIKSNYTKGTKQYLRRLSPFRPLYFHQDYDNQQDDPKGNNKKRLRRQYQLGVKDRKYHQSLRNLIVLTSWHYNHITSTQNSTYQQYNSTYPCFI